MGTSLAGQQASMDFNALPDPAKVLVVELMLPWQLLLFKLLSKGCRALVANLAAKGPQGYYV